MKNQIKYLLLTLILTVSACKNNITDNNITSGPYIQTGAGGQIQH